MDRNRTLAGVARRSAMGRAYDEMPARIKVPIPGAAARRRMTEALDSAIAHWTGVEIRKGRGRPDSAATASA